ncbi:thioredoxin reductase [Actinobaculum suis]|uniref:Thioredoxin reductase n=2 Tax=Actinobaculum suis TaxID=1657 RepID=A0A7Z8Y800_9ACTO|nr:thioredoxin reductase [Actinobaculum suis]
MMEMAEERIEDVIIVGSGPAGWTAAIYAGRAGLSPLVLAGKKPLGELMRTHRVYNFPGFAEGIEGGELMDEMRVQALRFGAGVIYEEVTGFALSEPIKVVRTDERVYRAKAVILAVGARARQLGIPGENEFAARGIYYTSRVNGPDLEGKEVAVVGGGDSAVIAASFLSRFARKVHLIHRRDHLRAVSPLAERVQDAENIEIHWNTEITQALGQRDGNLEAIRVRTAASAANGGTSTESAENATETDIPVDSLFVEIGREPNTTLLQEELDLGSNGYILVQAPSSRTSRSGVFACGDAIDPVYKEAINAAASGCRAAIDAQRYVEDIDAVAAAK